MGIKEELVRIFLACMTTLTIYYPIVILLDLGVIRGAGWERAATFWVCALWAMIFLAV